MKKTKVYYTVNEVPHYNEFDYYIPQNFIFYQAKDKSIPGNLWELFCFQQNGYKFCRDDGPAVEYTSGELIFQSSKCKRFAWNFEDKLIFAKNTNHIICKNCNRFCNQRCFI